jgi:hypothetical protein
MAKKHKFRMVGCRLAHIDFVEQRLIDAQDDQEADEIIVAATVTFSDPEISGATYHERSVIELREVITIRLDGKDAKPASKNEGKTLARIEAIAGFVGNDPESDGLINEFSKQTDAYNREIYLASLSYVRSVLGATALREITFPWSVDSEMLEKQKSKRPQEEDK